MSFTMSFTSGAVTEAVAPRRQVALGACVEFGRASVLQLHAGDASLRGVDVSWLSQYPHELETIYPPCDGAREPNPHRPLGAAGWTTLVQPEQGCTPLQGLCGSRAAASRSLATSRRVPPGKPRWPHCVGFRQQAPSSRPLLPSPLAGTLLQPQALRQWSAARRVIIVQALATPSLVRSPAAEREAPTRFGAAVSSEIRELNAAVGALKVLSDSDEAALGAGGVLAPEELAIACWKGKSSVNLLVSKVETDHMLEKFGVDVSAAGGGGSVQGGGMEVN